MGNSISSISPAGDNNTNHPDNVYPLTVNVDSIEDGHYFCFYPNLNVEQINNICLSMDGVATITDLTIVIAGARSNKTKVNTKYSLTSVKFHTAPTTPTPPASSATKSNAIEKLGGGGGVPSPVKTNQNRSSALTGMKNDDKSKASVSQGKQQEQKQQKQQQSPQNPPQQVNANAIESNDFEITLDADYYLVIAYSALVELADATKIVLLRSIEENQNAWFLIGSKTDDDDYYDGLFSADFKSLTKSPNPINPIKMLKVFTELPSIQTIWFHVQTYQQNFSTSFQYVSYLAVTNLEILAAHVKTVRNNANLMGVYGYYNTNKFFDSAIKKLMIDTNTHFFIHPVEPYANKNIFCVGQQYVVDENKHVVMFSGRKVGLLHNATTGDLNLRFTTGNQASIVPKNISFGFYHENYPLFKKGPSDFVTQIFKATQTLQLSRSDFQFYIGYIDPLYEIDIIGTILNANTLPNQKFIYYIKKNVLAQYNLPQNLYKIEAGNGITNIENFAKGVNVSKDFYLTLHSTNIENNIDASTVGSVEKDDIFSKSVTTLSLETLRRDHIANNQSMITSHTIDMKITGAYILDSQLYLPPRYINDLQTVVLVGVDATRTSVWNTAKLLYHHYKYQNWVMYIAMQEGQSLGNCDKFKTVKQNNEMIIVYPTSLTVSTPNSIEFVVSKGDKQVVLVSQDYIAHEKRQNYINCLSVYPGKVPAGVNEYQQYTYVITHKLSYINYKIVECTVTTKDSFIGGISNSLTAYCDNKKFEMPIIDEVRIISSLYYVDYFPTIDTKDLMISYLRSFATLMANGNNIQVVKFTCLLRVRKEWLGGVNLPEYLQKIDGKNKDFSLLFFMGGTATRYVFKTDTRTFTLDGYPSIVLDTKLATQTSLADNEKIYLEDPLDAIIKPQDDDRFVNVGINPHFDFQRVPTMSYKHRDFVSFSVSSNASTPWNNIAVAGTLRPNDLVYTKMTFLRTDWISFCAVLGKLVATMSAGKTNCLVFLNLPILEDVTIEIPSLKSSIENLLATSENFNDFSIIFDQINRIYTLTNIDVVISFSAEYYTFNFNRMYVRSKKNMTTKLVGKDNTLLDIIKNTFEFDNNSRIYRNEVFSITIDSNLMETYPQIQKSAQLTENISVQTDNNFWKNIRAFVYIPNISVDEVEALLELTTHLGSKVDDFFITSLVAYDITRAEPWICNRCRVLPNDITIPMSIIESTNYYHITVRGLIDYTNFMKFGMWKNNATPQESDIMDLDFLINPIIGELYDNSTKVLMNTRTDIVPGYMTFNFPDATHTSFPKFTDFTKRNNKYIVFTRPIEVFYTQKDTMNESVAVLEILNGPLNEKNTDFSEVINFVVQWFEHCGGKLKSIIIYTRNRTILKPSKAYQIKIGNLNLDTEKFTFTNDKEVLIYPNASYDQAYGRYQLYKNVFYYPKNYQTSPQNVVYTKNIEGISGYVGADINTSGYKAQLQTFPVFYFMKYSFQIKLRCVK